MKDIDYNAHAGEPRFRPNAWGTLATLAGLALFITLGLWQLDRAAEKRELLTQQDELGREAPLAALPGDGALHAEQQYARVELSGRYEADTQVLLDNMTLDGRVGYLVLTPLRLPSGEAVLVNRGWVPAGVTRSDLPDIDVDGAPRRISGRLAHLPRPGIRLGSGDPGDADASWPRVLLYPTVDTLRAALGERVPDYQVQLDPGEPDGYARRWQAVTMEPERHLGYAVQWFAFAVVLLAIWFILTLRRGRTTS